MSNVKFYFINFTIIGIIGYYYYCKIKNCEKDIDKIKKKIYELTNKYDENLIDSPINSKTIDDFDEYILSF